MFNSLRIDPTTLACLENIFFRLGDGPHVSKLLYHFLMTCAGQQRGGLEWVSMMPEKKSVVGEEVEISEYKK